MNTYVSHDDAYVSTTHLPAGSLVQPAHTFNLFDLPEFLIVKILRKLPLNELVKVLRTSKTVRAWAEAQPRLWKALPEVSAHEIPQLERYTLLGNQCPLHLAVRDIRQGRELWDVAEAVSGHMHRLRRLRLHFRDAEEGSTQGMKEIWDALGREAPELKRLALDMDDHFGALSSIPDCVFRRTPLPKLVDLQLTAVKLEEFVPAFAHVRAVRAAVASIAPFDRDTNDKLHVHFPWMRSLTLLGIQSLSAGGAVQHSLLQVPFIERPLDNLVLRFELQRAVSEPEVMQWLEQSLPYVRNATMIDNRCPATCNAVLVSLNGPEPRRIIVSPAEAGVQDVMVLTAAWRTRMVRFGGPIDPNYFVALLSLPGPIIALSIPADLSGMQILDEFEDAPQLETLALEVSAGFTTFPALPVLGAVRNLRFDADCFVDVDAQVIVYFAASVTPGVTGMSFSRLIRVHNSHLLLDVPCIQMH